jgi:ankyrin repeat protein
MIAGIKHFIVISLVLFFLNNCSSLSPLNNAVVSHKFNTVQSLVEKGEDINQRDPDSWRTPLIFAAYYRNNAILKYLLEKGASVNLIDRQGMSALHYASYYGDMLNVKDLLDHKADFNVKDYNGYTPLNYANNFEYAEIAKMLKDKGAK